MHVWKPAVGLTDPIAETQRKSNPPHGSVRSLSSSRKNITEKYGGHMEKPGFLGEQS